MTAVDDSWDPFSDPEGENALKNLAERLTPVESRALQEANAGQPIREVEVDHLVRLGLLERTSDGGFRLTKLGLDTVHGRS